MPVSSISIGFGGRPVEWEFDERLQVLTSPPQSLFRQCLEEGVRRKPKEVESPQVQKSTGAARVQFPRVQRQE
jgi:hypothetical protein